MTSKFMFRGSKQNPQTTNTTLKNCSILPSYLQKFTYNMVILHLCFGVLFNSVKAQNNTIGSTPQELNASDWNKVKTQLNTHKHAIQAIDPCNYYTVNTANSFNINFKEDGQTLIHSNNKNTSHYIGFKLKGIGYSTINSLSSPIDIEASKNQLTYQWNTNIKEWWINEAGKLEQWFSINERPLQTNKDDKLKVQLALDTDLNISQKGNTLYFKNNNTNLKYDKLKVWDANGVELVANMAYKDNTLNLVVDDAYATYPIIIDPTITQTAYIKASNTDANDLFGNAVAISGNTMVVGAPWEDSNATGVNGNQSDNSATDAGAAYVFVKDGSGNWAQQAYLKASSTDVDDLFGEHVDISGNTIVISARGDDDTQLQSGAAYIFVRSGTTWSQQAKLKASNAGDSDFFGESVAIDGDTVVVTSIAESSNATGVNGDQNDNSASTSGAVYVFVRTGTTWSQQVYLKASNTDVSDEFGVNVDIDGDTIVVGATHEDSDATGINGNQNNSLATDSGAAYIFTRSGTTWSQQAYIKASNTDASDFFGNSVAISNNTVVISSILERSNATGINGNQNDNSLVNSGVAYVYTRSGTTWSQQAYLKASNTDAYDVFGTSVDILDDLIIISATGDASNAIGINGNQLDNSLFAAGAAYLFSRTGTTWTQDAYIKASNTGTYDIFGQSVAITSNTIAVGAYFESSNSTGINGNQIDDSAFGSGAVYVYEDIQVTPCITYGSAWDISKASYNRATEEFYVGNQEITPNELFFKPDGTRMFVIGLNGDAVVEYDLSTPWDVSTASYNGASEEFSVAAQETAPQGLFFKPDGTRMFVVGHSGDAVVEYDLSTPWDVSTASYNGAAEEFSVAAQESSPRGVIFKPDGTRMFIVGYNGDVIVEYDLSIPWDVSTATYNGAAEEFSVVAQEASPQALFFKPDGTRMFVIGNEGDATVEYDLSTPWDVSTATYNGAVEEFSVNTQEGYPSGIHFKPDGSRMFIVGLNSDEVVEYDLSTPWDVSTASYNGVEEEFYVGGQETNPRELFFKPDGTRMFITGTSTDTIIEYDLSIPWDVSTASYNGVAEEFYVGGQENIPEGLFFKPDGTRMFVVGFNDNAVVEYDLSIPWDVSTASYNGASEEFSVTAQETAPNGLHFKPDGTRLFVVGFNSDAVVEYDLSTPWDVSTASYNGASEEFSVAAQEIVPNGLFFKPDGARMFIIGASGDAVVEYDLSTPWDVSTASYNGASEELSVAAQDIGPQGIFFTPDGSRMLMVGASGDAVAEYDMGITSYTESNPANDGSITAGEEVAISIENDTFTNAGGTLTHGVDYTITNLPTGLIPNLAVAADGATATLTLSGNVPPGTHYDSDDIASLQFTWAASAFSGGVPPTQTCDGGSLADSGIGIDFFGEPPCITYGPSWDVSEAIYNGAAEEFNVGTQETYPLDVVFSSDGTRMFVLGATDDRVIEYDLSTAWDVSTASYNGAAEEFYVGAEEGTPNSIFFKPDGTRMFILGATHDYVVEYDLSTPWDVSTASYNGAGEEFSVTGEDFAPSGLFFKPDGTRMFIMGASERAVVEYDLSTPWDVSTASWNGAVEEFSVAGQLPHTTDLFINPNGTRMFITGVINADIVEYDLSTPWDVSTATYNGAVEEFYVGTQEDTPQGLFFTPDGSRMFTVGDGDKFVVEYDLGLTTFTESNPANDGSIIAGEEAIITIENDTFTNAGGTLTHGVDYTITNLPAGLVPNLAISADGSTATLTLSGNATNHQDVDDVASLQFSWAASAFSGGVAPTQTCDGGSLADSGFGIDFEENPKDLTVLIRISDGEAIGVEQQTLFVELNELLGNPTDDNIDIVVKITKDSRFMTNYDPILTNVTINGIPETVNNADWSFDNSDPSYYIFTNTGVINANGNSSFALSGMFLPDIPVGSAPFTVEITPNSGGDSVTTNNTDADTLNFFQIGRTR